jgi:hypothetical protein
MNKTLALFCAALLEVAYAQYHGKTAPLPVVLGGGGLVIEETLTAHENGIQVPFGFIASEIAPSGDQWVYIAIRGTCSLVEWLGDGFIVPAKFPGYGNVAGGFNGIYRELAPQIVKTLKRVAGAGTKLVITGHSLGAALAHLAAADVLSNLKLGSESYTFCGPRCGDPDFANAMRKAGLTTYRFFNTEDVVPTVPLATCSPTATIPGLVDWFLSRFDHGSGEFEHIGEPIPFTFQTGSLEGNHSLNNMIEALNRMNAPQPATSHA